MMENIVTTATALKIDFIVCPLYLIYKKTNFNMSYLDFLAYSLI